MLVLYYPHHTTPMNPAKRVRRTATSVMAGVFDVRPPRDVLTSLLNGVTPYKEVEGDDEARRARKRERKERHKEKKRAKAIARARQHEQLAEAAQSAPVVAPLASSSSIPQTQSAAASTSSFWRARPTIHLATNQRPPSVTPPSSASSSTADLSPSSTPGPLSSGTSRTSSKRPHTPDDGMDLSSPHQTVSAPPLFKQPRRKRVAVKKGWKGWVEGSPPPSEKLINLDAVPILQERRTRSGKSFDAIGVGKDGWV
ncbi:hypothetical protein BDQ17DRAFT_1001875 [Cyathus striatus]|nr:hypothetical protein BDQ17DRAFT_1001875 [Cyathus striatus]